MSGPVIDLGELRHGPDTDPLPRPPLAKGRPLRSAVVLLLVLISLAAAGPPTRREAVTLPGRLGADALVAGDLFVLVEPLSGLTGQRRLTALHLPGGEPAWQVPLPAEGRYWGIAQQGELLLATGHELGPDRQGTLTVALDRATGAYHWQQPGSPSRLGDGNLLLHSVDDDQGGTLRAVDPCCGTVRWQVPVVPGGEFSFREGEHGVDRVVLSHANGPVEVLDAVSGAVLVRADLAPPGGGPNTGVQIVEDMLLTFGGSPTMITAYGLDGLEQRWRTPADEALYASDCGVVVCLQNRSGGLRVVDAATGRLLWGNDRWAWVWPYAGRLVATTLSSAGPGAEQIVVLEPQTGRVLAELGRWELAQFPFGGPMIGVRPHPDGGLLVAELDIGGGTVRLLDVLRDAARECQAVDTGRLLCRRQDASFGLWQLPT
ncbi:PQQ-binding-like beta-propeller repeat protein [Micromonospora sp. NPDC000316]|uniref:outer membrane protein assembly factor BamB family protein n=1 Tax=Micromonospora sp. NPDC000316 TaxID=3364216 RepID=UPI0036CFBD69